MPLVPQTAHDRTEMEADADPDEVGQKDDDYADRPEVPIGGHDLPREESEEKTLSPLKQAAVANAAA